MIATVYVVLVIAALALSFVSVAQSKGESILGWAVFFLSLALLCGAR